ncbi:hydroxymethylpyrimidine/phosphomethylpyrimidine kinase [Halioxenophilus sp. WMMB6]|uniref:bifunctional hydroxymethylpyrimidine kinase/phosphomethylpyrimidine kinase n=1 Tax=Halioxenophilus sp. WMMB6 TaxID=3073815 RepID=UPI00295ED86B|nr:bifunctional hydroxymethylpyrimidine kinase/phosphomethylpyrimidine kinase [Halioxenophilus sp. WMMB6]
MINLARAETPVVLSLNAVDPSGTGGLHADIEACASIGTHCLGVAAAIMARDTQEIKEIAPTKPGLVIEQTRALLEDIPVKVIKGGQLGSIENIEVLHSILVDYPDIPVVLEPELMHASTKLGADQQLLAHASRALLLPKAHLVVMSNDQAFALSNSADTIDACAAEILDSGCEHLLVFGCDRNADRCQGRLFGQRGLIRTFDSSAYSAATVPGAATVFTACIAAYLAHGLLLHEGIAQAQNFTLAAISQARNLGMGRAITNRMHWTNGKSSEQN